MMSWTEKTSARLGQLGLSRALLAMLAALLIYGVLNVFLNFFNSWALSSKGAAFSFPLFYSLWHMVASALGCWLLILIKKRPLPSWSEARRRPAPRPASPPPPPPPPPHHHPPPLSRAQFVGCWRGTLPLAVCTTANVALNNASLSLVSLFLNQILKALGPVITCLLAVIIEHKRYPWQVAVALLGMVAGCICAMDTDAAGGDSTTRGVLFVFGAVLASAAKPVFAAVMMSGQKASMSPESLVFYDSVLSFFAMAAVTAVAGEFQAAFSFLGSHAMIGLCICAVGSLAALGYNLSIYYVTKLASSLTLAVFTQTIKVGVIAAAAIWAAVSGVRQWVGIAVFVLAVAFYTWSSWQMKKAAAAAAQSPAKDAEGAAAAAEPGEKQPLQGGKEAAPSYGGAEKAPAATPEEEAESGGGDSATAPLKVKLSW